MMISITSRPFGVTRAGEAVTCFDMTNRSMTVSILNYGCTIQRVLVPDQIGAVKDVVLGYDDLSGYETGSCSSQTSSSISSYSYTPQGRASAASNITP